MKQHAIIYGKIDNIFLWLSLTFLVTYKKWRRKNEICLYGTGSVFSEITCRKLKQLSVKNSQFGRKLHLTPMNQLSVWLLIENISKRENLAAFNEW